VLRRGLSRGRGEGRGRVEGILAISKQYMAREAEEGAPLD